jgi:hypothetical protein
MGRYSQKDVRLGMGYKEIYIFPHQMLRNSLRDVVTEHSLAANPPNQLRH